MAKRALSEHLTAMLQMARRAVKQSGASAILILAEWDMNWTAIREVIGSKKLVAAVVQSDENKPDGEPTLPKPDESLKIHWVYLDEGGHPTLERLSLALLEAVADDYLIPGDVVVALYSGFDADQIDSLSVIRLGEHLERLTGADLRKLETHVPLDTLKSVVDLAVEIGREGREGHPVGALILVGDTKKVMELCRPMGFDPVRGYNKKERHLGDRRVRESVKEIAKLDGATIVDRDGHVRAAAQFVDAAAAGITLSKGLGSRHWAGAAASRETKAIAVVVSQSSGTVRIFQDGRIVLRIEPLRRAMKWQDFEPEYSGPPDWTT